MENDESLNLFYGIYFTKINLGIQLWDMERVKKE